MLVATAPLAARLSPSSKGGVPRAVGLGLAGLAVAGLTMVAVVLMPGPGGTGPAEAARPADFEQWPEIKDGVPALKGAAPAHLASAAVPAAPVPASTLSTENRAPLRDAARLAALPVDPSFGLKPSIPDPVTTNNIAPPRPERPEPKQAVETARPATPVEAHPLPPARPKDLAKAAVQDPAPEVRSDPVARPKADRKSRPVRAAAVAPPPRTAPKAEAHASAAPAAEASKPPEEDRVRVFGVAMPEFIPTGRKIKETVETIGNAVTSIPSRF